MGTKLKRMQRNRGDSSWGAGEGWGRAEGEEGGGAGCQWIKEIACATEKRRGDLLTKEDSRMILLASVAFRKSFTSCWLGKFSMGESERGFLSCPVMGMKAGDGRWVGRRGCQDWGGVVKGKV